MADFVQQTSDKAKDLVPWRSNSPWWTILVEGIIIGIMGLMLAINPAMSAINIAIAFTVVLIVIGLLQLWAVFRGRIPERLDALVAARGSIAVFGGLAILLLLTFGLMSVQIGRVLFGLTATIFGVLGFILFFTGGRKVLRGLAVDSSFFLIAGLLVLYAQAQGGDVAVTVTRWLGWISLLIGLALIGFAVWRRQQGQSGSTKSPAPKQAEKSSPPKDEGDVKAPRKSEAKSDAKETSNAGSKPDATSASSAAVSPDDDTSAA
ncbi:MAG: hypothetical protein KDD92_20655 [Caldilineaceae bacterium]|nr:hypothetical protein [Caldilineaceae bacterium]